MNHIGSVCFPLSVRNNTKEDISSLPVADAKFQEAKSDYLGLLVVTPELVAKKIKSMKDNKSPGVDGIPPKLLMETVEQISIPLARVFNLSLKEGVVPFEWKEANIIPLFKKGSRNKSELQTSEFNVSDL